MDEDGVTGLREQKRAATRRALQRALIELSVERGFDHVTIEDVGRAAQVSPRTFFNYFASKEDAATGMHPGAVEFEPVAVERFLSGGGPLLGDLLELVVSHLPAADPQDLDLFRLRRRLFEREPALLGRQVSASKDLELRLGDLVLRRLDAAGLGDSAGRTSEARLVSAIAITLLRFGWMQCVASEARIDLGEGVRHAHELMLATCAPSPSAV